MHIAIVVIIVASFLLVLWAIMSNIISYNEFNKARNNKVKKEKIRQEQERKQEKIRKEQEQLRMQQNYIRELLSKAQEGIDHKAIYELARLYYEGEGIEQNYVEAFYWVYKAEVLGNPLAPKLRKNIEKVASEIQKKVAQKRLTEEN